MAATDLTLTCGLKGEGVLVGSAVGALRDTLQMNANSWTFSDVSFTWGTGNNQIKEWYRDSRTLAAGANDDLDLAGGVNNPFGTALTFTKIRFFVLAIDSPDGTKVLRVGPQAVANGWQGWFGGVTSVAYEEVYNWMLHVRPITGWTVTAGTGDILRVNNPGAGAVTYRIWIGGDV